MAIPGEEKQLKVNNSTGSDGILIQFYKEYPMKLVLYLACVYHKPFFSAKSQMTAKNAGDSCL